MSNEEDYEDVENWINAINSQDLVTNYNTWRSTMSDIHTREDDFLNAEALLAEVPMSDLFNANNESNGLSTWSAMNDLDTSEDDFLDAEALIAGVSMGDLLNANNVAEVRELRRRWCDQCNTGFSSLADLQGHLYHVHNKMYIQEEIENDVEYDDQIQAGFGDETGGFDVVVKCTMFDGAMVVYEIDLSSAKITSVKTLFRILNAQIRKLMRDKLNEKVKYEAYKIQFVLYPVFYKEAVDSRIYNTPIFNSFLLNLETLHDINYIIRKAKVVFKALVSNFVNLQSNWVLDTFSKLEITMCKVRTMWGGDGEVILPRMLANKYSIINPRSVNGDCFKRAVYCHPKLSGDILRGTNASRKVKSLAAFDKLINNGDVNWEGISMPFSMTQCPKFEKQNPRISLFVYHFDVNMSCNIHYLWKNRRKQPHAFINDDDDCNDYLPLQDREERYDQIVRQCMFPLYLSKESREIEIVLLLLTNKDGQEQHFIYCKSLSSLLAREGYKARTICNYCLFWFSNSIEAHREHCASLGGIVTNVPMCDYMTFNNYRSTQMQPFFFVGDFECSLVPSEKPGVVNEHRVNAYCYVLIDYNLKVETYNCYVAKDNNENVVDRFVAEVLSIASYLEKKIEKFNHEASKLMCLTPVDARNLRNPRFRDRVNCWFCNKPFLMTDVVDRHHEHVPPYNFQGLAHRRCNLQGILSPKITFFFHNGGNYDCILILKNLSNNIAKEISIIPKSTEKLMCLNIDNVAFTDSLNFFHASVRKIASTMSKENDFVLTRAHFKEYDDDKMNLLLGKLHYPYTFVDSVEKFNYTHLPEKHHFYDDINRRHISDEEYQDTLNIWNKFEIQQFGEFHSLYLKLDVFILADAIIKLRKSVYSNYKLDMVYFLSLSHLTFNAALKFTQEKVSYIKDRTMFQFFETSIMGGYSGVGNLRACKANNKYMADYNPDEDTSYLLYLDANNLYGLALSQMLLHSEYQWLPDVETNAFKTNIGKIMQIPKDNDYGYVFEVSLSYPDELHDKFAKNPPIYENKSVDPQNASEYQREMNQLFNKGMSGFTNRKLVADLYPKKNLIIHYRLLQLWISLGVQVDDIRRVVKFRQKAWLKPYVEFNTNLRKAATNDLDVTLYKNMNNLLYGKTLENKRNRENIKICRKKDEAIKWMSSPLAKRVICINDEKGKELALVCMRKREICLTNIVSVGSVVLNLAKEHMQSFYYNFVQKHLVQHDLIYQDTDSLIIRSSDDPYDKMLEFKNYFDMASYDQSHPVWKKYYDESNKKRMGCFKDEYCNAVITHVVALKSKAYAVRYVRVDNQVGELKKAKGVKRSCVDDDMTFNDYVVCLENNVQTSMVGRYIRSKRLKLQTIDQTRKALNNFDSKRFILPDGVQTLPYGHVDIELYI